MKLIHTIETKKQNGMAYSLTITREEDTFKGATVITIECAHVCVRLSKETASLINKVISSTDDLENGKVLGFSSEDGETVELHAEERLMDLGYAYQFRIFHPTRGDYEDIGIVDTPEVWDFFTITLDAVSSD